MVVLHCCAFLPYWSLHAGDDGETCKLQLRQRQGGCLWVDEELCSVQETSS
jgi:hypothetical protein